jgi:cyclic beta-1,2-glucan synthetase
LGLKLKGKKGFTVSPCIPESWKGFTMEYRKEKDEYHIEIKRGSQKGIYVDGKLVKNDVIPYGSAGSHEVVVII